MSEDAVFGRLVNEGGELIAEGPCSVDEAAALATLEPGRIPGLLQRERGALTLRLDSGRVFKISGQPMVIDYRAPAGDANEQARRRVIRLRLLPHGPPEAAGKGGAGGTINDAQEATAAGAAGEGASAVLSAWGRPPETGDTPAAR